MEWFKKIECVRLTKFEPHSDLEATSDIAVESEKRIKIQY